ncbi:MAG TPA: chemotaxis protein CheD [Tepidisphaeraceae bacterium]|nr:chemotaxis protein CheD [Tepidisphaeraceae bacterium]
MSVVETQSAIVVGVSDAKASNDPQDTLVTYSLGSCIGVTLYDPQAKVAGLLHFQLPSSTADVQRSAEKPLMFADTGMNWLLKETTRLGADKRRFRVRLAGAAQMLNDSGVFDIGRRNHTAIRKIMWQLGMFIEAEQVGGDAPRTLILNVNDGSLIIKSRGEQIVI